VTPIQDVTPIQIKILGALSVGDIRDMYYLLPAAFPKLLSESLCKMASLRVAYSVFVCCISKLLLYSA
jgi:hypothetical protein